MFRFTVYEAGSVLARRFWVFHVVVVKNTQLSYSHLKAPKIASLTWMTGSHALAKASGPCHGAAWVSLQHGSSLPWEQVLQERAEQTLRYLLRSSREVTYHHFHGILLVTWVNSILPSYTKTSIPGGRAHEAILETGHHREHYKGCKKLFIHSLMPSFIHLVNIYLMSSPAQRDAGTQ